MNPSSVENLEVFSLAHALVLRVYKITCGLPEKEAFGLQGQLRRAAVSVTANLVEGSERGSSKEFRRYVAIARGSAAETRYLLRLAAELALLPREQVQEILTDYERVVRMLTRLHQSLDWHRTTDHGKRETGDGFTLLEMIIAIVLIAVLTGIAISRMSGSSRVKLEQAARMVSHDLNFARDWAMTHATSVRVVFDLDNNTYGASYYSVDSVAVDKYEWISSYGLNRGNLYVSMDEFFEDVDVDDLEFFIDSSPVPITDGYASFAFSSLGTPRRAHSGAPLAAGTQNRLTLTFGGFTEYVSIQPYSGYIYICSQ